MPIIKTVSGKINLRNQSGQVRVFHAPREGGKGTQEVFLDKASKIGPAVSVVHRVGNPTMYSAVEGLRPDVVGMACEQSFDISEGEVLKVFVDTRNNFGKRFKRGSVYLRVRKNAAYRVLEFQVTDHPSASFHTGMVEGCFDILTPTEVDALGVKVLPQYRRYLTESTVRRIISNSTVIVPEKESFIKLEKKVVKSEDGEDKEIYVTARPRRRLGRK